MTQPSVSKPSALSALPFTVRWSTPWVSGKKAIRPEYVDVVVQWTPPALIGQQAPRKPVNMAIVIDRSGSMSDPLTPQHLLRRAPVQVQPPPLPMAPQPWDVPPRQPWVTPGQPYVQPGPAGPWDQPMWLGDVHQAVTTSVDSTRLPQNTQHTRDVAPVDQSAALKWLASHEHLSNAARETPKTKLDLTIEAAWAAVQTLGEEDRVSIVSFDDQVKVVCSHVKGSDKVQLRRALDTIRPGNTTALFDGWAKGALEVAHAMSGEGINRVLLLSDGRANVGERNPDHIATRLANLAETGVSTSVFGVGLDYDEDLLQRMAQAGDGNYYYIQGSDDFLALFEDEFQGLSRVIGKKVRLNLAAEGWAEAPDVLNEFPLNADGSLRMPNLVAGKPLDLTLRLKPKATPGTVTLTLSFEGPDGQTVKQPLVLSVPTVAAKTPVVADQSVVDRVAELLVARAKKKAIAALDLGDLAMATATLQGAGAFMANASASLAMESSQTLMSLAADMSSGDHAGMRKSASYQAYNTRSSKAR